MELSADHRWVLGRAFAEPDLAAEERNQPEHALRLARALALSARIAHRCGSLLITELGADVAQQYLQDSRLAVARHLRHRELVAEAGRAGVEVSVPVILLKGMALWSSGASDPGARDSADVDILVPSQDQHRLRVALEQRGFSRTESDDSDHHQAVCHPAMGLLEVHRFLPGVRVGEAERATAEELLAGGLCNPVPDLAGLFAPSAELLAAHLLAHATHQHGHSPAAYPVFRLISDLADLEPDPRARQRLLGQASRFIRSSVSTREIRAVADLCSLLEAGDWEHLETGDAGALLRHGVAGATDQSYRRRLKIKAAAVALARRDWRKIGWRLERASSRLRRTVLDRRWGRKHEA